MKIEYIATTVPMRHYIQDFVEGIFSRELYDDRNADPRGLELLMAGEYLVTFSMTHDYEVGQENRGRIYVSIGPYVDVPGDLEYVGIKRVMPLVGTGKAQDESERIAIFSKTPPVEFERSHLIIRIRRLDPEHPLTKCIVGAIKQYEKTRNESLESITVSSIN